MTARLLTVLLSYAGIASADVMPVPGTQRVKPIFDRSDLVCMCTAESTNTVVQGGLKDSAGRPLARITTTTTFAIAVAYKQNRSAGQQLAIRWIHDSSLPLPPEAPFKKGRPFLLFLVSTSPPMYEIADQFLGMTPFSAIPATDPTSSGFPGLEMTLTKIVNDSDREDKLRALRLLEGFDAVSQQTETLMWRIADSGDLETALTAWAVLLKTKRPNVVAGLSGYLDAHPRAPEAGLALIGIEEVLSNIRDERALASLEKLSSSKDFQIRDGALHALRGIKDPRSVPTLIRSLDDERQDLQYVALITLSEIVGKYEGDYAPSMFLFDKKPQYYISLWKQWWADEGSRLYPPAHYPN
jgi:HEAT repeats